MRSRNFPRPVTQRLRLLRRRIGLVAIAPVLLLSSVFAGCSRSDADHSAPLLVFAASDLRDALAEIAHAYRAAGGDSAVLVFGSTGDLATQIANGAPADLFFSASTEVIDQLAANGHVVDSSREVYAVGRLAVIARCTGADTISAPTGSGSVARQSGRCPQLTLTDLANDSLRTIAIADPSHAPYGRAARQALERAGLWETVSPKLVLGASISQAELFVTSGNADAGIVALALLQRDTTRVYTVIDSSLHEPLIQTVAVVTRSTRGAGAGALIAYMQSSDGRAVMQRYGFESPVSRALVPNEF